MRRLRTRRVLPALLLPLLTLWAHPSPATAATTIQYWNLSRVTGKANGQFTMNPDNGYWHVSGTVDDYRSGDDCTRINIRAYNQEYGTTYRMCGGLNRSFDLSGYTYGPIGGDPTVTVTLCQDYTWGTDPCTKKVLYIS